MEQIIRTSNNEPVGMRLVVPRLDGLNEYTSANRQNPYMGAKMKKQNEALVITALKEQQLDTAKFSKPVWMNFRWVEKNRRRDMDNISSFGRKVILDALVKQGVLQDDGWKYVKGFADRFTVDKNDPRVEVEIIEADAVGHIWLPEDEIFVLRRFYAEKV